MDDVNILAGHINALNTKTEKMAKALEQHRAHLSSFISLTDNRIKNLIRRIKDNSNFMLKMTTAFNNKFFELYHSFANVSEILITQVHKAPTLKSKLDKLENAIQSLLEGNISPFLISKHMFGRFLLRKSIISLENLTRNFIWYTPIHPITILMDNSFLPESKTSSTLQLNSLFHPKVPPFNCIRS